MFVAFCRLCFRLRKWSFRGNLPEIPQYLILVGPHTSGWDFIYGVAARDILKTDIKFIGKKELFKFPLKKFFLKLGGYPVNRQKNENAVEAVTRLFSENPRFILAISPEGTRGKVKELRTGFYHISRAAQVPCVLVGMDYKTRQFVISPPYYPGENLNEEMLKIRLFFSDVQGKNPALGISD